MPRVSVIMPVYNAARTIAQALDSAFAQTFSDFEMIVADDGSTDALEEALSPYRDRLKFLRQNHSGIAAARNAGVAAARADYIAFLDADDLWMPERLAKTVAVLDADPGCVLVFTGAITIDKDGTPTGEYSIDGAATLEPGLFEIVSGRPRLDASSVLMRRATFDHVGGFDAAAFGRTSRGQDSYLYSLASELGRLRIVPEPLIKYRAEPMRNRMWKSEAGRQILMRKWRARYGRRIRPALRIQTAAWARAWNQIGLDAIERINLKVARAAFRAAWRLEPWNLRLLARFASAYLPAPTVERMERRRAARRRIRGAVKART